jgi:hypothetical protein
MKEKREFRTTSNRSVFNKDYKRYLENVGKIFCSRCGYHKGENITHKVYGGFDGVKYPSWKLASKNRKQWMKKNLKIKKSCHWYKDSTYIEINF